MIKKSLFSIVFIAAAMTGAMVLSSCSHDEATYSEENVKEAKHAEALAKYQQTFVSMFGQPASNQCWDFTLANSAKTRGESSSKSLSDWPTNSYNNYGYTDRFVVGGVDPMKENKVEDIFHNGLSDLIALINATPAQKWNPKGTYMFRPLTTQPSSGAAKYFSVGADLGGTHNWFLKQIHTNGGGNGNSSGQHTSAINFDIVNQSFAAKTWFVSGSSKKDSKIDASTWPLDTFKEVKYEFTNKNGEKKTYTFWAFRCHSTDENGYQGSYTDFIWWVDQIDAPTYKYSKRFFVEDLGGVGFSDIDFNDIVFDVVEYTNGDQEFIVRALGGTLPITITVCRVSWSKPSPIEDMINTGYKGETIEPGLVIARKTISGWDPDDNSTISVQVQDKNGFNFITGFPLNGDIPLMVAFSTAKAWKAETVPVTKAWMSEEGEPAEDD